MSNNKYGFVYLWYDKKHKRYYVGCHWGHVDDGYICSSSWMMKSYKRRPQDFKRRILKTNIQHRPNMYLEEGRYLSMISEDEIKPKNDKPRYYNLKITTDNLWHQYDKKVKTIGEKISKAKMGKSNGKHSEETKRKMSRVKKERAKARKEKREYIESMCPELAILRNELLEGRNKLIKITRSNSSKKTWQNMTEEAKKIRSKKLSEANKGCIGRTGQTLTEEHKRKISESKKGKKWFNNGVINKLSLECPAGFTSGKL